MADDLSPELLLEALRHLSSEHGVRAQTFLPDLALVGLVLDITDASLTALELLESDRPYRAYTMVRIAFEATQRLLVLGTSSNYIELGARAWLYYRMKDSLLTSEAEFQVGPQEKQLIELWATHFPAAHTIVEQEIAGLKQLRGPDNFLGRGMAEAVDEAYAVLASEMGGQVPAETARVNRALYRSLSRESHAAMRLEPSGLRIDADGFVAVDQRPRTKEDVAHPVRGALETTLMEALAALRHRIRQRRLEHAESLTASLTPEPSQLHPGYLPDFGRHIVEEGLGHAEAIFPRIPVQHVRELKDGTLSVSVTSKGTSDPQIVTFDFKGDARERLLDAIAGRFPEAVVRSATGSLEVDLPDPMFLTIRASLGREQQTAKESFVPFIVTEFSVDPAA